MVFLIWKNKVTTKLGEVLSESNTGNIVVTAEICTKVLGKNITLRAAEHHRRMRVNFAFVCTGSNYVFGEVLIV